MQAPLTFTVQKQLAYKLNLKRGAVVVFAVRGSDDHLAHVFGGES